MFYMSALLKSFHFVNFPTMQQLFICMRLVPTAGSQHQFPPLWAYGSYIAHISCLKLLLPILIEALPFVLEWLPNISWVSQN